MRYLHKGPCPVSDPNSKSPAPTPPKTEILRITNRRYMDSVLERATSHKRRRPDGEGEA